VRRFLFVLLSLSLGLNAGLLYVRYAEKPHDKPFPPGPERGQIHRPPPPPKVMIEDQLAAKTRHMNLSSDQQNAIRLILEKHVPTMVKLRQQARVLNRKMTEVYAGAAFDKTEFQNLMKEAGQARSQADSIAAVILMEEASVLNEEQRRLFAKEAPMASGGEHRPPPPKRNRR